MLKIFLILSTFVTLSLSANSDYPYEQCLKYGDYWISQGYLYVDHYSTSDSWCSDIVNMGEVICRDALNFYKQHNQIDFHVRDMCYGVQNETQGNCIAQVLQKANYETLDLVKIISECN